MDNNTVDIKASQLRLKEYLESQGEEKNNDKNVNKRKKDNNNSLITKKIKRKRQTNDNYNNITDNNFTEEDDDSNDYLSKEIKDKITSVLLEENYNGYLDPSSSSLLAPALSTESLFFPLATKLNSSTTALYKNYDSKTEIELKKSYNSTLLLNNTSTSLSSDPSHVYLETFTGDLNNYEEKNDGIYDKQLLELKKKLLVEEKKRESQLYLSDKNYIEANKSIQSALDTFLDIPPTPPSNKTEPISSIPYINYEELNLAEPNITEDPSDIIKILNSSLFVYDKSAHDSARLIQRCYRRHIKKLHKYATLIQKNLRKFLTKNHFLHEKIIKIQCIKKIQQLYRRYLKLKEIAKKKIFSWYRNNKLFYNINNKILLKRLVKYIKNLYYKKKYYIKLKKKEFLNNKIILIQKNYRGYYVRATRYYSIFNLHRKIYESIIIIQKNIRNYLIKKKIKKIILKKFFLFYYFNLKKNFFLYLLLNYDKKFYLLSNLYEKNNKNTEKNFFLLYSSFLTEENHQNIFKKMFSSLIITSSSSKLSSSLSPYSSTSSIDFSSFSPRSYIVNKFSKLYSNNSSQIGEIKMSHQFDSPLEYLEYTENLRYLIEREAKNWNSFNSKDKKDINIEEISEAKNNNEIKKPYDSIWKNSSNGWLTGYEGLESFLNEIQEDYEELEEDIFDYDDALSIKKEIKDKKLLKKKKLKDLFNLDDFSSSFNEFSSSFEEFSTSFNQFSSSTSSNIFVTPKVFSIVKSYDLKNNGRISYKFLPSLLTNLSISPTKLLLSHLQMILNFSSSSSTSTSFSINDFLHWYNSEDADKWIETRPKKKKKFFSFDILKSKSDSKYSSIENNEEIIEYNPITSFSIDNHSNLNMVEKQQKKEKQESKEKKGKKEKQKEDMFFNSFSSSLFLLNNNKKIVLKNSFNIQNFLNYKKNFLQFYFHYISQPIPSTSSFISTFSFPSPMEVFSSSSSSYFFCSQCYKNFFFFTSYLSHFKDGVYCKETNLYANYVNKQGKDKIKAPLIYSRIEWQQKKSIDYEISRYNNEKNYIEFHMKNIISNELILMKNKKISYLGEGNAFSSTFGIGINIDLEDEKDEKYLNEEEERERQRYESIRQKNNKNTFKIFTFLYKELYDKYQIIFADDEEEGEQIEQSDEEKKLKKEKKDTINNLLLLFNNINKFAPLVGSKSSKKEDNKKDKSKNLYSLYSPELTDISPFYNSKEDITVDILKKNFFYYIVLFILFDFLFLIEKKTDEISPNNSRPSSASHSRPNTASTPSDSPTSSFSYINSDWVSIHLITLVAEEFDFVIPKQWILYEGASRSDVIYWLLNQFFFLRSMKFTPFYNEKKLRENQNSNIFNDSKSQISEVKDIKEEKSEPDNESELNKTSSDNKSSKSKSYKKVSEKSSKKLDTNAKKSGKNSKKPEKNSKKGKNLDKMVEKNKDKKKQKEIEKKKNSQLKFERKYEESERKRVNKIKLNNRLIQKNNIKKNFSQKIKKKSKLICKIPSKISSFFSFFFFFNRKLILFLFKLSSLCYKLLHLQEILNQEVLLLLFKCRSEFPRKCNEDTSSTSSTPSSRPSSKNKREATKNSSSYPPFSYPVSDTIFKELKLDHLTLKQYTDVIDIPKKRLLEIYRKNMLLLNLKLDNRILLESNIFYCLQLLLSSIYYKIQNSLSFFSFPSPVLTPSTTPSQSTKQIDGQEAHLVGETETLLVQSEFIDKEEIISEKTLNNLHDQALNGAIELQKISSELKEGVETSDNVELISNNDLSTNLDASHQFNENIEPNITLNNIDSPTHDPISETPVYPLSKQTSVRQLSSKQVSFQIKDSFILPSNLTSFRNSSTISEKNLATPPPTSPTPFNFSPEDIMKNNLNFYLSTFLQKKYENIVKYLQPSYSAKKKSFFYTLLKNYHKKINLFYSKKLMKGGWLEIFYYQLFLQHIFTNSSSYISYMESSSRNSNYVPVNNNDCDKKNIFEIEMDEKNDNNYDEYDDFIANFSSIKKKKLNEEENFKELHDRIRGSNEELFDELNENFKENTLEIYKDELWQLIKKIIVETTREILFKKILSSFLYFIENNNDEFILKDIQRILHNLKLELDDTHSENIFIRKEKRLFLIKNLNSFTYILPNLLLFLTNVYIKFFLNQPENFENDLNFDRENEKDPETRDHEKEKVDNCFNKAMSANDFDLLLEEINMYFSLSSLSSFFSCKKKKKHFLTLKHFDKDFTGFIQFQVIIKVVVLFLLAPEELEDKAEIIHKTVNNQDAKETAYKLDINLFVTSISESSTPHLLLLEKMIDISSSNISCFSSLTTSLPQFDHDQIVPEDFISLSTPSSSSGSFSLYSSEQFLIILKYFCYFNDELFLQYFETFSDYKKIINQSKLLKKQDKLKESKYNSLASFFSTFSSFSSFFSSFLTTRFSEEYDTNYLLDLRKNLRLKLQVLYDFLHDDLKEILTDDFKKSPIFSKLLAMKSENQLSTINFSFLSSYSFLSLNSKILIEIKKSKKKEKEKNKMTIWKKLHFQNEKNKKIMKNSKYLNNFLFYDLRTSKKFSGSFYCTQNSQQNTSDNPTLSSFFISSPAIYSSDFFTSFQSFSIFQTEKEKKLRIFLYNYLLMNSKSKNRYSERMIKNKLRYETGMEKVLVENNFELIGNIYSLCKSSPIFELSSLAHITEEKKIGSNKEEEDEIVEEYSKKNEELSQNLQISNSNYCLNLFLFDHFYLLLANQLNSQNSNKDSEIVFQKGNEDEDFDSSEESSSSQDDENLSEDDHDLFSSEISSTKFKFIQEILTKPISSLYTSQEVLPNRFELKIRKVGIESTCHMMDATCCGSMDIQDQYDLLELFECKVKENEVKYEDDFSSLFINNFKKNKKSIFTSSSSSSSDSSSALAAASKALQSYASLLNSMTFSSFFQADSYRLITDVGSSLLLCIGWRYNKDMIPQLNKKNEALWSQKLIKTYLKKKNYSLVKKNFELIFQISSFSSDFSSFSTDFSSFSTSKQTSNLSKELISDYFLDKSILNSNSTAPSQTLHLSQKYSSIIWRSQLLAMRQYRLFLSTPPGRFDFFLKLTEMKIKMKQKLKSVEPLENKLEEFYRAKIIKKNQVEEKNSTFDKFKSLFSCTPSNSLDSTSIFTSYSPLSSNNSSTSSQDSLDFNHDIFIIDFIYFLFNQFCLSDSNKLTSIPDYRIEDIKERRENETNYINYLKQKKKYEEVETREVHKQNLKEKMKRNYQKKQQSSTNYKQKNENKDDPKLLSSELIHFLSYIRDNLKILLPFIQIKRIVFILLNHFNKKDQLVFLSFKDIFYLFNLNFFISLKKKILNSLYLLELHSSKSEELISNSSNSSPFFYSELFLLNLKNLIKMIHIQPTIINNFSSHLFYSEESKSRQEAVLFSMNLYTNSYSSSTSPFVYNMTFTSRRCHWLAVHEIVLKLQYESKEMKEKILKDSIVNPEPRTIKKIVREFFESSGLLAPSTSSSNSLISSTTSSKLIPIDLLPFYCYIQGHALPSRHLFPEDAVLNFDLFPYEELQLHEEKLQEQLDKQNRRENRLSINEIDDEYNEIEEAEERSRKRKEAENKKRQERKKEEINAINNLKFPFSLTQQKIFSSNFFSKDQLVLFSYYYFVFSHFKYDTEVIAGQFIREILTGISNYSSQIEIEEED